ncbi:MAG: DUF3150 domain-containing protein [Caldisericota bacterium]|nr:DUF3150 domain-containing protein [Caldisericota bacterium]
MAQVITKDAANLVCVLLEVHIWSGRRHLDKTDLVHSNPEFRKLPEKDLANLGSVKICDPEDIKKFHTIKGKAERALKRAGLPVLGAIGIPIDNFDDVHDELVQLQAEFTALAGTFISDYDQRVSDWKMKHTLANPAWANLFAHIPTATHVAGRIAFDFHPFKISAPADDMKPELNARYESQLKGLKGELMSEVANEATSLITDYLTGSGQGGIVKRREYVTQKTIGPLKRAAAKLNSFRFIDSTIGPLADVIEEVLKSLPPSGRIDGNGLIKVWSLARMLSSPKQAAEMAALARTGSVADEILGTVVASDIAVASTQSQPVASASIQGEQLLDAPLAQSTPAAGSERAAIDLSLLL